MNREIHPIIDADTISKEKQCDLHSDSPPDGLVDRSLGIFSINLPIRKCIIKFVSPSSYFDAFILAAIFLNSMVLACVDYRFIDENYQPSADLSLRNNIIEQAETVFTAIFATECILKIIAYGLFRGKHTYLRDGWNGLDFVIVIVR